MDDITLEKLMEDFDSVLNSLNSIKDPSEALQALVQISNLIEGSDKIELDNFGELVGPENHDHVLHKLLDKMQGSFQVDKATLEAKKQELKDDKSAEVDTFKRNNPDYDQDEDKKAELTAIEEKYDIQIKQIDEYIGRFPVGITTTKDITIDLAAEAKSMGDKIFRTADIRKELSERGLTQDDFLAFYEKGKTSAEIIYNENKAKFENLSNELKAVISAPNEDHLYKQLSEKESVAEKAEIAEKIRKNIKNNTVLKDYLQIKKEDGSIEIDLNDDANKIQDINGINLLERVLKAIKDEIDDYEKIMKEQQENIAILEREIEIIQAEKSTDATYDQYWEVDSNGNEKLKDTVQQSIDSEKKMREEQIRASMGFDKDGNERKVDKDFQENWNTRVRRFAEQKEHAVEEFITYTDENGQSKNLKYKTIEDYPDYEEDVEFLNIREYKKHYQLITLYENLDKDLSEEEKLELLTKLVEEKKLDVIDPDLYKQFRDQKVNGREEAKKWLDKYLDEAKEYVDTYHGFTNEYGVKYSTLKTAGSTLKALKPVKGNLPLSTKIGNGVENFFRFFGLRKPEFSRINENGEKVRDIKGGLLTIGTDALIIGGAVATGVIGGPLAIAGTYGVAYAAKGIVTLGNVIASRAVYKKHKYDIDNNLPTLGRATIHDREVARRDYYRTEKGMNRFTSWIKAKSEKYIFRGNAKKTEQEIMQKRIEQSNASIEGRFEQAKTNKKIAAQNQTARQEDYKKVARHSSTYNDIVRDPDTVDKDEAAKVIAINAAVVSNGGSTIQKVNPTATNEYKGKYKKQGVELEGTRRLGEVNEKGDSVAATAITSEQRYRAAQEDRDRSNRFWTALLTIGGRMGFDFAKTRFMEEHTTTVQGPSTKTPDQVIPAHDEVTQVPVEKEVFGGDLSKSVSDFNYNDDVYLHTFGAPLHSTSKLAQGSSIDGFAISFVKDGKQYGISIGESTTGFTSEHVQTLMGQDISKMPLKDVLQKMIDNNPDGWKAYLDAKGIPQNTKLEDIFTKAVQDGDVYGQSGLGGWRQFGTDNLITRKVTEMVEQVKHVGEQVIPGKTIPGKTQTITTQTFSGKAVAQSALRGAAPGVGVAVGEGLHEAAHQTKKKKSGTFEQTNPRVSRMLTDSDDGKTLNRDDDDAR